MGRARQTATTASGVGAFTAVLGAHRGLGVAAQKQRDAEEQTERERALEEWAVFKDMAGGRAIYDALVGGYRETLSAGRYEQLIWNLTAQARTVDGYAVLAAVIALGDPVGWPNLSDPAVVALGRYFANVPHEASFNVTNDQAELILDIIDGDCSVRQVPPPTAESLLRLQPLCEGVGAYLTKLPVMSGRSGSIVVQAAMTLRGAATAAITGPLASWEEMFVARFQSGKLSTRESEILEGALGDWDCGVDSVRAVFFTRLQKRLELS
jgi:hypothetical protein